MNRSKLRQRMERLLVIGGLCAAGCEHAGNMAALNDPPRALTPRRPDQVEMYMTSRPTRSYVEVALIDGAHLPIGRVRECAAGLGCDALYVDMASRRPQQGICLVYVDPATVASNPAPAPSGLWAQSGGKWSCSNAGSAQRQEDHPGSGGL
jgi:hypothetical protein